MFSFGDSVDHDTVDTVEQRVGDSRLSTNRRPSRRLTLWRVSTFNVVASVSRPIQMTGSSFRFGCCVFCIFFLIRASFFVLGLVLCVFMCLCFLEYFLGGVWGPSPRSRGSARPKTASSLILRGHV